MISVNIEENYINEMTILMSKKYINNINDEESQWQWKW